MSLSTAAFNRFLTPERVGQEAFPALMQRLRGDTEEPTNHGAALASFYADLWNSHGACGVPVRREELEHADEELANTGWRVNFSTQAGYWHAVPPQQAYGRVDAELYAWQDQQRAESGGVSVDGRWFAGGTWIPKEGKRDTDPSVIERARHQHQTHRRETKQSRQATMRATGTTPQRLRASLAPHRGKLSPEEQKSAKRSIAALKVHHGDVTLHRLEELASGTAKALERAKAIAAKPGPVGQRAKDNVGKLQAKLGLMAHMLDQLHPEGQESASPQGKPTLTGSPLLHTDPTVALQQGKGRTVTSVTVPVEAPSTVPGGTVLPRENTEETPSTTVHPRTVQPPSGVRGRTPGPPENIEETAKSTVHPRTVDASSSAEAPESPAVPFLSPTAAIKAKADAFNAQREATAAKAKKARQQPPAKVSAKPPEQPSAKKPFKAPDIQHVDDDRQASPEHQANLAKAIENRKQLPQFAASSQQPGASAESAAVVEPFLTPPSKKQQKRNTRQSKDVAAQWLATEGKKREAERAMPSAARETKEPDRADLSASVQTTPPAKVPVGEVSKRPAPTSKTYSGELGRHKDYQDARGHAQVAANATGLDVALRATKEYGKHGFNTNFASKNDSDYARAEIVKPETSTTATRKQE